VKNQSKLDTRRDVVPVAVNSRFLVVYKLV